MYDQQSNKRGGGNLTIFYLSGSPCVILDYYCTFIGNSDFQNTVIKGPHKDSYLFDLEQQITETRDRRKRETQENQDWWEKRKEPQFPVKMPTKPHPSQVSPKKT